MLPMVMLAFSMQTGTVPQNPKLPLTKPVVSSRQTTKRDNKNLTSRHGKRLSFRSAQATCYTVAENGRATANNERCFSNGPEYLCAMPTNLNPSRIYCRHKSGKCNPIYVTTKSGKMIEVHVVDHCPHSGVIDFNPSAANKIFLNKDSSKQDWWSRGNVKWAR